MRRSGIETEAAHGESTLRARNKDVGPTIEPSIEVGPQPPRACVDRFALLRLPDPEVSDAWLPVAGMTRNFFNSL
jgi:hypothetical protein